MREIFDKASELGLLIKETDVYRRFRDISEELENESGIKEMLDNFFKLAEDLKMRENSGDIIEKFERDELESMSRDIAGNDLIMRYLGAKNEYICLLSDIQKAVSEDNVPGGN